MTSQYKGLKVEIEPAAGFTPGTEPTYEVFIDDAWLRLLSPVESEQEAIGLAKRLIDEGSEGVLAAL